MIKIINNFNCKIVFSKTYGRLFKIPFQSMISYGSSKAVYYKNNYEIIKEDLCLDEGIYYELFKVRSADGQSTELDSIYYEVSPILLRSKNPLMKDFLQNKIDEYNRILGFITEETVSANNRRVEIQEKISIITGMLNYL